MSTTISGTSGVTFPDSTSLSTTPPASQVKAWVNFNGTGTVAIRAAYNVSSITDQGTGLYTANFTTAMVDSNYVLSGFATYPISTAPAGLVSFGNDFSPLANNIQFKTTNCTNVAMIDSAHVQIAVFR